MRKTILILSCALFLFALLFIGCGKQEEPAEMETPAEEMETPAEEPVTVDTMQMQEEMPDSAAIIDTPEDVDEESSTKVGTE